MPEDPLILPPKYSPKKPSNDKKQIQKDVAEGKKNPATTVKTIPIKSKINEVNEPITCYDDRNRPPHP